MFTFLVVLTVLVFVGLLLAAGMRPVQSTYSLFELERRAKHSKVFKEELNRELLLPDILALLRLKVAVLLVFTVVLLIASFGWVIGIISAVVVAVLYAPLSQTKAISKLANTIYRAIEPTTVSLIYKMKPFFDFLRDMPLYSEHRVDSREELQALIDRSGEALTDTERKLIVHALSFNEKPVSSIMTPRNEIKSVSKGEFLGPLVLDELHALGHSRLPVTNGDVDQIVGILHLRDMLSLDIKRSSMVEKAMEPKVYYIRKDDTLEKALGILLKVRHHLLIVTDDESKTVGLVTLEDIIEALIGRKILDIHDII